MDTETLNLKVISFKQFKNETFMEVKKFLEFSEKTLQKFKTFWKTWH